MKTIHIKLTDEQAFDDMINVDCLIEVMRERIQDSDSWEDQRTMRSWLKTLYCFRSAYEKVVMEVS